MKVVISAGHGKYIRGASGYIDEVDEARKVVPVVADFLRRKDIEAVEFYDDTSTEQQQNLETIVDFHNSQERDLDVSIHFNAYEKTAKPMGTECFYITQYELAERVTLLISAAGDLTDRGPKDGSDLYFLNNTDQPSILVEVCFVDSEYDVEQYRVNFTEICLAIAQAIYDHLTVEEEV